MSTHPVQHADAETYRAYHRRRNEERQRRWEEERRTVLTAARSAIGGLAPGFPAIRAVHLYGSVVEPGRFRAGSDLDVALEIDDLEQEGPFARALEQALGRPVDVRPLAGPLRRAVEEKGELVYERRDPGS